MIKLYLQWIVLGIENIKLKRGGDFTKKKLPKFVAALPSAFMYATERKTKNLSVNKYLCIGCKLCEKKKVTEMSLFVMFIDFSKSNFPVLLAYTNKKIQTN